MQVTESIDIEKIRSDFPILKTKMKGRDLVYFDNAASTQKPKHVIDAIKNYYEESNANVHRGVYGLAEKATMQYEGARSKVSSFINSNNSNEIIFTRGTTESINLVASTFGRSHLNEGDEVIISEMEHHSNIVPWQMLREEKKIVLKVIPINEKGEIDINDLKNLITDKTKLISIVWVSNSLGTINPIHEIIDIAKKNNIKVLVDAAQAIQHMDVDVQALDCDFLAFSGHKLYGPTGIGVLFGKEDLLNSIPPFQGGGEMIKKVSFEKTEYNELPYKFEAGTPNMAGAIGLAAAIDYIEEIGIESILSYETELLNYANSRFQEIEGLKIYGEAESKTSVISFLIEGLHPTDVAQLCDTYGIAIRTGHHCTQPIMDRFKIVGTSRASIGMYNTKEEIDYLVESLKRIKELLS